LDEDDRRFRVREDVAALGREVRLVDRDGERAAREDREVDLHPLRARPGEDRDAIAGLDAEPNETGRDRADALGHLLPRHLVPAVRRSMAIARTDRVRGRPVEEHLGEVGVRHARCPGALAAYGIMMTFFRSTPVAAGGPRPRVRAPT